MARNTWPLFSTDRTNWSWSVNAGTDKTSEAIAMTDFPPTAENIASIIITGTLEPGSDSRNATVYCQLGYGFGSDRIWGPSHTIEDTSGNTAWALSTSEAKFEANIYAQTWFTLCDVFRIIISTSGDADEITGEGAACVS